MGPGNAPYRTLTGILHPCGFRHFILALALLLQSKVFLHSQSPRLAIALTNQPHAGGIVVTSLLPENDGHFIVTEPNHRDCPDGLCTDTALVFLEPDGQVARSFTFTNQTFRLYARFSDQSVAVEGYGPLDGEHWRHRVLPDGRVDLLEHIPDFPRGPSALSSSGATLVGDFDGLSSAPIRSFVLEKIGDSTKVVENRDFASNVGRAAPDSRCLSLALGQNGQIWAFISLPLTTISRSERLFRFLPSGEIDPEFRPVEAEKAWLAPLPDGGLIYTSGTGITSLNADGSFNKTVAPPAGFSPLILTPQGVLGDLSTEIATNFTAHNLVRILGDGSLDPAFASEYPLNHSIRRAFRQPSGRLLLLEGAAEGEFLLGRVSLMPNGSVDPKFVLERAQTRDSTIITIVADGLQTGRAYGLQRALELEPARWEDLFHKFFVPTTPTKPREIWVDPDVSSFFRLVELSPDFFDPTRKE